MEQVHAWNSNDEFFQILGLTGSLKKDFADSRMIYKAAMATAQRYVIHIYSQKLENM